MDKLNDASTVPNDGQTPNDGTPTGQTPNPQGQTGSGTQRTPIESLPADTQEYLKRLLDENKSYRKRAQDQERAAQAAEEARLKEQGEFKALAEKHEARVQALEPVADRYHALSMQVALQIEGQIKNWPPEVLAFDPGSDAPVEERLAWIEKSRPLIEKLQMQARSQSPGNMPNPRPTASTPEDAQNHFLQQMRASGKYGA